MLTVKERGHFVATMRWVHVSVMETLAAWVPATPEMEVKLLFGEHIWDAAQHADALGKRTFELRLPLQHSVRAADPYVEFLETMTSLTPTPERLAAMYDVLLPALAERQRRYLEGADKLVDAPTVRILERALADLERMIEAARSLRQELPALQHADGQWTAALKAREAALEPVAALPAAVAVGASIAAKVPRETKVVRGVEVRSDPAREACFKIVHLHQDVPDSGGLTEEARRQRVHREYNQEVQTIEIAALSLVDFPDAPWELRMELARQCWDEARHAEICLRRLKAMGGWKGMYPIANLDWSVVGMLDSLAARLAVQNRTFEGGSLDIEKGEIAMHLERGDEASAEIVEAVGADEIHHVRFGNRWLKRMSDAQPRAVLEVAQAMAWLRRVVRATGGESLHEIATNVHDRELAGFSSPEISEVARLADSVIGRAADGSTTRPHE